jgi:hypothetical protein
MAAPDTVTDAIELLREQGYDADFELVDGQLCIAGKGAVCAAAVADVERLYRFEGPSDPGDMMIVFGLRDPSSGVRGTLAAAYGPAADPELYEHLTDLSNRFG